jgi:hypothetical protein
VRHRKPEHDARRAGSPGAGQEPDRGLSSATQQLTAASRRARVPASGWSRPSSEKLVSEGVEPFAASAPLAEGPSGWGYGAAFSDANENDQEEEDERHGGDDDANQHRPRLTLVVGPDRRSGTGTLARCCHTADGAPYSRVPAPAVRAMARRFATGLGRWMTRAARRRPRHYVFAAPLPKLSAPPRLPILRMTSCRPGSFECRRGRFHWNARQVRKNREAL